MTEKEKANILGHVFVQWMSEKGILDEWLDESLLHAPDLYQRLRSNTKYNNSSRLINILTNSMHWRRTDRGHEGWNILHMQWQRVAYRIDKELRHD